MSRLILFPASLWVLNAVAGLAAAQSTATTTVTATSSTVTVSETVALTATVQPAKSTVRPTGTVTFLDGTAPLSSSAVALTPNGFASATFPQTFGTLDATLTNGSGLTGDLNGDGVSDLLVYGDSDLMRLQTFISNGKGGYTASALQTLSFVFPGISYPSVTSRPVMIDLNGDGKLDLLFGIMAAYGNGDGTFAAPVPVTFLSSGFVAVYSADLNADGKADILAVNASPVWPNLQFAVTVFLNQGGGSFTSAGTVPIGSGGMADIFVYEPTFLDLNGDGKLDLVLQWNTVDAGSPQVSVLLNNGSGSFESPTSLTVPYPPNNVAASCLSYETGSGDVNGDGKQDLVLALCDGYGDTAAIIFLGNGDGTFASPLFFDLPTPPNVIVPILPNFILQDVNLDGKLDLVFGSGRLALGTGDGTFTLGVPLFPLTNAPYSYPLVQLQLSGNPVPSVVYLLTSVTPSPAAVFTPQSSSSAALSLATWAVGAHTITARYSGDAIYSADASSGIVVTVNQAASAVAATSSANPSFAGQSVTLTAKVTSPGPTPTGNVTFSSGSTPLATVPLAGGSATYTTSSFATAGMQTITVSYSGDANNQASSTTLSQGVNAAFTLAPEGSSTTTLTVQAGQTVNAPINATGVEGFSGQVTFACSGLPANASCSFSPATIAVAGTAAVSTLLTINTVASTMTSQLNQGLPYGLGLASLLLFWPTRRRGSRIFAMLLCALSITSLALTGCGAGSGPVPAPETAAGSYHFTVTASSGNTQAQSSYTLVVQ